MPPRIFDWKPDPIDHRDFRYTPEGLNLPNRVDLRETLHMPKVFDQGDLGSCVGNAVAGMLQFLDHKTDGKSLALSRLWIYYQARKLEGMEDWDAGCYIRDAMKIARKIGIPPEKDWPYRVTKFDQEPPQAVYDAAAQHRLGAYARVPQDDMALCEVLAKGQPIVLGFQVSQRFASDLTALTGTGMMPTPGEWFLGGHAVMLIGFNFLTKTWLLRNSWGPMWGKGGYFTLPWRFLLDPALTDDLWTASRY